VPKKQMKRTEIIKTNCIQFDNVALNGLMVQKLLLGLQTTQTSDVQGSINNLNQALQTTNNALSSLATDLTAIQAAIEAANIQISNLQNQVGEISEFLIILQDNSTVFQNAA